MDLCSETARDTLLSHHTLLRSTVLDAGIGPSGPPRRMRSKYPRRASMARRKIGFLLRS